MTNHVFVAIDTPDIAAARRLAEQVREWVGGLKLGLEFFSANGPDGVAAIATLGLPLFLDLKLHDIPNTVGKAVAALSSLRPALLTVHAAGGAAMLAAARAAAAPETQIIAVTVLTSLDADDLSAIGMEGLPAQQVSRLGGLARDSGVDGIVCSGREVADAKSAWPDGYFVVPGIRPEGSDIGDQKRVMSPRRALDVGATTLVIGRPITGASDPTAAARAIAASL